MKSFKKILFFFLPLLFLGYISNAQIDKVFWFAVPEVTANHADRPIYLQLAALGTSSNVKVSIPAAGITIGNYTIAANTSQTINLNAYINALENDSVNAAQNKGLLIEATEYITAYYEVLGSNTFGIVNTDIFSLKGANAIGKEFYVPFQTRFANIQKDFWNTYINGRSTIDIVATEDNTVIKITPTKDYKINGVLKTALTLTTITLQRGQTFSVAAYRYLGADHMSGTYIESTKPIAVTIKDDSIGETNTGYDLAGDQIIPVIRVGKEYIVDKGYAFVTATVDNTVITVNGVANAPINKGQTFTADLTAEPGAVFITTSEPAYLLHLVKIDGEMAVAVMPPLTCTGSQYVTVNRSSANSGEIFSLLITAKAGTENFFKVNGGAVNTIIDGSQFQPIAGTPNWVFARFQFTTSAADLLKIPTGGNIIENTSGIFHLGTLNGKPYTGSGAGGNPTGFRYGYFTDFGNLNVSVNVPNQCIVSGDSILIYPGDYTTYSWSTGSTDTAIYIKQSGTYSLTVSNGNGCVGTEDFTAIISEVPDFTIGPDVISCTSDPIELKALDNNFSQVSSPVYEWNTGSSESSIAPTTGGTFILKVTNNCGSHSDTMLIKRIDIHTYNLFTPNEDELNETFVLKGLEEIGSWELSIFNRWGERVFMSEKYNNSWKGLEVNEGVYYYDFKDTSGMCPELKGWLHIVK